MNMTTMLTLSMFKVGNTAVPFSTFPNMDDSIRQAVGKSCARKNTQVIFTRKKVSNARKNLFIVLVRMNAGANDATFTGTGSGTGSIAFFGVNALSIHK